MALGQYLKDTRSELNHVAWPTRVQTIVFTVLVIITSVLVSLYLGFFDFLFTNALGKVIGSGAQSAQQIPFENSIELSTTTVGTTTSQ
jgi:preprotein translocase SecE subunit